MKDRIIPNERIMGTNSMRIDSWEIMEKGKLISVPSILIDKVRIIVTGKILRMASIEEEWYEDIADPTSFIEKLKNTSLNKNFNPDTLIFQKSDIIILLKHHQLFRRK